MIELVAAIMSVLIIAVLITWTIWLHVQLRAQRALIRQTQKELRAAQILAQTDKSAVPAQREPEPQRVKRKSRWRGLGVVIGASALVVAVGRGLRDRIQPVAALGAGAALIAAGSALVVLPPDTLDDDLGWPGDPPRVLGPVPLEPTPRPPTPVPELTATATRDGPSRQSGPNPVQGGPGPESEPASSPIPPGNGRDPTPVPTVAPTTGPPQPPTPTNTGSPPTNTGSPPAATPLPTKTPPSSPSPTHTATRTPTSSPTPSPTETPPRCLIYADVPELLELCLVDEV